MTVTSISSETLPAFRNELAQRYEFLRELGQGGMATVYLARDLVHDRLVAVKVLLPELAASIGADRFLREIDVGRTLQHPNIIGVLDSGSADGKLWYAMPFVDGASLRERLDQQRQLGIEDTIALTRQIADALMYAHQQGIIHRDIKPENILLSGDTAYVADFGIARAVSVAGGEQLTRTGMAVGTPTYMSPEQAMGSKDVAPQSDIYSLACVVYEMLAGQPPFTGPTAMALLARHSLDNVPSLKIVRGTIPDAVEDAIGRALAKVPADRFKTAVDFANALTDDAGAAERRRNSIRASSMPSTTVIDAPVARPRKRVGTIAALVAVPLLAAGGWFGWKSTGAGAANPTLAAMEANNIAVLYFDDRSPDKSLAYLADGLTEALIHELGLVKTLRVTSRNGVLPFKGKAVPTDSIAGVLKVGTIVSGTVQSSGDQLRVRVDLADARTGEAIGSTTIEKTKQEAFALQDSLVAEVAAALRKQLGQQVQVLASKASTKNSAAWEAFQRAKMTVAQGDSLLAAGDVPAAKGVYVRADAELAKVQAQDGSWSSPPAMRAMLHYKLARMELGDGGDVAAKRIEAGIAIADKAVSLNPADADALEWRGTLRYLTWLLGLAPSGGAEKLVAAAESDLDSATTLNPVQASALNTISHLFVATSRTVDANLAAQNAYTADPYLADANKTVWRLFQSSLDLDNGQKSKQWCDEGAKRFPTDYRFAECRLWLFALKNQTPAPTAADVWKANDAFLAANKVDEPEFAKRKGMMLASMGLVRAGLIDSARSVAARAKGNEQIDPSGDLMWLEVLALAQIGDKDQALSVMGRFYAAHPEQRTFAARDETWWLEDLKADPRYKRLVGAP